MNKRVMGLLGVTRSFGDNSIKEFVIAEPFISSVQVTAECKFVVMGCDGVFDVLSDLGESDLALKLITQTSFPAYGYHIERGATTLWECFYELKEDKLEVKAGWNINSLNHHFWGSVSGWFFRKIGGIELNPDLISPKTVVIDPVFPKGIDWARASRRVSEGDIKVEWKRVNGKIDLKVNAPQGYRVIRKDIAQ